MCLLSATRGLGPPSCETRERDAFVSPLWGARLTVPLVPTWGVCGLIDFSPLNSLPFDSCRSWPLPRMTTRPLGCSRCLRSRMLLRLLLLPLVTKTSTSTQKAALSSQPPTVSDTGLVRVGIVALDALKEERQWLWFKMADLLAHRCFRSADSHVILVVLHATARHGYFQGRHNNDGAPTGVVRTPCT